MRQIPKAHRCFMCPTGCGRHRERGLRKSLDQRRHDLVPQSIAGQLHIRVRLVVDVAKAMAAEVGIDGVARLGEPGTRPGHSAALGDTRHSSQAGRPAPAQGLQQKGLGLILLVMREQDQARSLLESHLAQSGVTGRARPRFHAFPFSWRRGKVMRWQTGADDPPEPNARSVGDSARASPRRSDSTRGAHAARRHRYRAGRPLAASRAAARSSRARRCRRPRPALRSLSPQRAVVSLKRP